MAQIIVNRSISYTVESDEITVELMNRFATSETGISIPSGPRGLAFIPKVGVVVEFIFDKPLEEVIEGDY